MQRSITGACNIASQFHNNIPTSLYKTEIKTLRYIARASHDIVSWRCVRERDRDRFSAENERWRA